MSELRSIVFGTAGHVDHGKSALVRALTGTDPDRLAEEKAREMTIDLGFAFLDLSGLDQPVAIVDVPGHEMFVRNMVAGATGIDAAIFVVAADEGIMPQTREHLQVLCRLNVPAGVIVLTKLDKVTPDRLAAAEAEARELVAGTFMTRATVVPVSARTGEGLEALRDELAQIAAALPVKQKGGPFRLPIDRAFIIKGAGTVVTGTVISGSRRVGDRVDLLPGGRELRIRALQVHNQTVTEIGAGQRAAINLAGVEKEEIRRGEVLAEPGAFAPSQMLDVRVSLSADAPRPLVPRARLRVHHGTAEVMARVVLLEGDTLAPGQSALAQLRLESLLLAAAGDAFVLRSYSPMHVIGGGVIVDPHPPKRTRTAGAEEVATREQSAADEVLLELLAQTGSRGLAERDLQVRSGLALQDMRAALAKLAAEQRAVPGRRQVWFSAAVVAEHAARLTTALAEHHRTHPIWATAPLNVILGEVAPRPELREAARLGLESLTAAGIVVASGERIRLSTHQAHWPGRLGVARDALLRELKKAGLACPPLADLSARLRLGEKELRDVLEALVESSELISISPVLYVPPTAYAGARARVVDFLMEAREMSIAEARELLNLSRKYLLPFLEALDRDGTTVREGEARRLGRAGKSAARSRSEDREE